MHFFPVVVYPVGHVLFISAMNIVTAIDVTVTDMPNDAPDLECTDLGLVGCPTITVWGDLNLVLQCATGNQKALREYTEKFVVPAQKKELSGVIEPPPAKGRVQVATQGADGRIVTA
jgi:hypothetical protein